MSQIAIVNEKDEVIGAKERSEILQNDIYRVSALMLKNSKGEILLAQRGLDKKHDPGKWGPAVAGTVEEGESYEANIKKEAGEELGIYNCEFAIGPKELIDRDHRYFCQWFSVTLDWPTDAFKLQKEEVESVRWISKEALEDDLKSNPGIYLRGAPRYFNITQPR